MDQLGCGPTPRNERGQRHTKAKLPSFTAHFGRRRQQQNTTTVVAPANALWLWSHRTSSEAELIKSPRSNTTCPASSPPVGKQAWGESASVMPNALLSTQDHDLLRDGTTHLDTHHASSAEPQSSLRRNTTMCLGGTRLTTQLCCNNFLNVSIYSSPAIARLLYRLPCPER